MAETSVGSLGALNIFRSFLIGAVGVLGAVLVNPGMLQSLPGDQTAVGTTLFQASLLFGLSVTLGTLIYTIHRALIYPLVLRWVFVVLCIFGWYPLHWSLFKPLGCPMIREARRTLWLARRDDNPYNEPLTAWSDQVHFLYASGLVLSLLVWFIPAAPLDRRHCYAAWSAILLLGVAIINDLRLSWVASDVRPTMLQFSSGDLSHRCALRLVYGFFLALGLGAFVGFSVWTIRLHG